MSDFSTHPKRPLRRELLAARRALTAPQRAAAAAAVQRTLLAGLPGRLPSTVGRPLVAAYSPIGGEPGGADLPDVLADALPAGGLLLPVLRPDHSLDWAVYDGHLVAGPHGLVQPAGPRLGPAAVAAVALVVVPALAVDSRGVRLGRGGGSYDRALAHVAPETETVALLHDHELRHDPLPAEPHDRRVHAAITPGDGWRVLAGAQPQA